MEIEIIYSSLEKKYVGLYNKQSIGIFDTYQQLRKCFLESGGIEIPKKSELKWFNDGFGGKFAFVIK